ncbi:MAG: type II toxin-antitoxin system VapC family toxin, partial [Acidobacteria bacterium]|nr:type II toxin-antitoxin system VapC family toxin [Acidobacteriota bacterium]
TLTPPLSAICLLRTSMTLADVPDGATVFIDANIFVYHFTGVSPECKAFLERAERTTIRGTTGAHILLEVLHRLMMIEAVTKGLIPPSQPAKKIKQNWQVIQQLKDYDVRMSHFLKRTHV